MEHGASWSLERGALNHNLIRGFVLVIVWHRSIPNPISLESPSNWTWDWTWLIFRSVSFRFRSSRMWVWATNGTRSHGALALLWASSPLAISHQPGGSRLISTFWQLNWVFLGGSLPGDECANWRITFLATKFVICLNWIFVRQPEARSRSLSSGILF